MRPSKMPSVRVLPDVVGMGMGMDVSAGELFAKSGSLRFGYNYESSIDGGLERIGGIEAYDGRPEPDLAVYTLLRLAAVPTGIALGNTLTGSTSGATGVVIYLSGDLVALTRAVGSFQVEAVTVSAVVVGAVIDTTPTVTGPEDNHLSALAAANYRVDIGKVPGAGRVMGLEILGATLYAWRNNAGTTALVLYKASAAGWVVVPMFYEVSFTAGSALYAEGSTLTRAGVSATVKRVVLESGSWSGGTAAGRLIVTAPSPGNFTAGAAAGGGACTLSGTATEITLAPITATGESVRTDVSNFTSSVDRRRIYGCDGTNREFELGDDVLVPLTTGMGAIRASAVRVHKLHAFFGFRGSVQHSSIGNPYSFSPITGAAEIGTGDVVNDFVSVGGATDAAAMMILCQDSLHVLYGNNAGAGGGGWNLVTLSRVSGCIRGSAQDAGGVVALDAPGVVRYPASQSFGNFAWDVLTRKIGKIAAGQTSACSVFVPNLARYRVWFADGTGISGRLADKGAMEWTLIDYRVPVVCAISRELGGRQRTFVGDNAGGVYETDVGRSFAGVAIQYAARLNALTQRAPMVIKQYRGLEVECEPRSAFTLKASAEFFDGDEDIEPSPEFSLAIAGRGFRWDLSNWDEAYFDVQTISRRRFDLEGQGASISLTLAGESAEEMPHTLRAVTLPYTPLRTQHF